MFPNIKTLGYWIIIGYETINVEVWKAEFTRTSRQRLAGGVGVVCALFATQRIKSIVVPHKTRFAMKKYTVFKTALWSLAASTLLLNQSRATVVAGDVAFLGVNATDPDQFAILVRNTIAASDTFFVTDGGITGTSGAASVFFRATEGFLQYTAPAGGVAAGSVLLFTAGGGVAANAAVARNGGGSAGSVSLLNNGAATPSNTNFTFATAGDSLTIYTVNSGTHLTGTPNLVAFIAFGPTPYGSGTANSSNVPTISGGQVLNVTNLDNAIFTNTGSISSTTTIATLSNAANFSARDTTPYDLTTLPSTVAIPEPSTFAAILGGLALVGVAARRRRSV